MYTEALPIFLRDILNAEVITQRAEKKPHSHPPSITQVSGAQTVLMKTTRSLMLAYLNLVK